MPAVEYTPIFNWSQPRSRKVSLLSFIAASALLHAFCFYIFQIIYPPTIALPPTPARVNFITDDSEQGRVLLRWIEAEDPALTSMTQRAPDSANFALPKIEHVPSYLSRQPVLKQLPPLPPALDVPSSNPPAPVALAHRSAPEIPLVTKTEVTFAFEAAQVGKPVFPAQEFRASSKEPPQAAQFHIAINGRGAVQHCFLENSSGDPQLDAQAARYLLRVRFPEIGQSAIENDLLWTIATLEWGSDLAPRAPETAAPTAAPKP